MEVVAVVHMCVFRVWRDCIMYMCACVLSHFICVWLYVMLWTVAHQAPLFMEFFRQEYWSGLPCPPPGDLPNPGIEPRSPTLQVDSLPLALPEKSHDLSEICPNPLFKRQRKKKIRTDHDCKYCKISVAQTIKKPPAMQETWVWSLGWEDPLKGGMVTHSSILAWRIPWTEEPGGWQSLRSQRVVHNGTTEHSMLFCGPTIMAMKGLLGANPPKVISACSWGRGGESAGAGRRGSSFPTHWLS